MSDIGNGDKLESLTVRRLIPATPEQVFRAWTKPSELKQWWGPKGIHCLSAEIDLRVGGRYRIANAMPDGSVLWIAGEFEEIERPHRLVFTWKVEPQQTIVERVSVQFEASDEGTIVLLQHDRIATAELREQHKQGWFGCLDGLAEHLTG